MAAAMVHRGRDDEGIYVKPQSKPYVGLGHRRLKIIDLSESGHQPMSNEDSSIWTVFNGEVYNFRELRKELEGRGHIFKSNTDTEVILHLYEEHGVNCVKYLRGMFAFAIWDEKTQLLLLARDRVGKKPLLYYYDDKNFCFASEFSSLLASSLVEKEINYDAIHYYLTFGYIPAPLTIYKNVFKLLPAHRLILKDKKISSERYWQLDYSKKNNIPEEEAEEEILRLLREAVKIRLYSDVPLGAFLSGGIDSSTVVALMSQLSEKKVKTFSIGFEESDYDELRYARNIAERFDTEHHEFIVKPNALEILPLLVERYGEPYADSSCIPTYYVAQQTKRYVSVALNGDGGDELFAGYERYQAMLASEKIPRIVKGVIIASIVSILPDSINPKNRLRRIKRFLNAAGFPLQQRYLRWVGIFDNSLKNSLYTEDFKKNMLAKEAFSWLTPYLGEPKDLNLIDRLLMADTHIYLPNDLLVKVDIASMANSLEVRSPFLDHKVMEFAARLPCEYKLKTGIKKYILKKAIKDLVPAENVHRRKMGFGLPIGRWFREELKGFVKDALLSESSLKRRYFKSEIVKRIVDDHTEARKDYAFQLWALLMLELWHQRFID
jgi:asparagine synthase (glutamine-hydrolysing)